MNDELTRRMQREPARCEGQECSGTRSSSPAVHHHGPGVGRVTRFNPAQEGQDRCGVLGHAVIRPRHELELSHLSLLTGAVLICQKTHQKSEKIKSAQDFSERENIHVFEV